MQRDVGQRPTVATVQRQQPIVWYCPSRWLLAHHDQKANIQTLSSHMCLADLANDGESSLAIIDLKQSQQQSKLMEQDDTQQHRQAKLAPSANTRPPPYECRMRVYRGQQLVYSHFLDDVPSCLIATSVTQTIKQRAILTSRNLLRGNDLLKTNIPTNDQLQQPLLTLPINDDVYFYHKLRPSHRISLEDEDSILDTLNKSEVDAWQMVKQDKVDVETMRELLISLSQEFGNHELTSHSINFLALNTPEARKQYLAAWKFKRLVNGFGEHLMSMDTICCAAARLKYNSPVTKSGDFGYSRDSGNQNFLNSSRWNRILDIQRDGLILGTEDRHLLVYELRTIRTRLECHFRLTSVPDHIIVERRSPSSFDSRHDLRLLSYKILVSCRNCHIYLIELPYLNEIKLNPVKVIDLLSLKCNVSDMCWVAGGDQEMGINSNSNNNNISQPGPDFIVTSLDRRVYCFSSQTGATKWIVKLDSPITSLVSLPKLEISSCETSLIGVGSQSNRIDFYNSSSGRIVDSIYFSLNDYPQAMTFGRFGREDNCLCLVTKLGHLVIFILKRTAKFAHGQCLSSAASYAADTLEKCGQRLLSKHELGLQQQQQQQKQQQHTAPADSSKLGDDLHLGLSKPPSLPSAFALTKSTSSNAANQALDSMLQIEHDCHRIGGANEKMLDSYLAAPQVQVPFKGRDFVDQILVQSRNSRPIARLFAKHMHNLRDKIKLTNEQQQQQQSQNDPTNNPINGNDNNRVGILNILGLGNTYRVKLGLHFSLELSSSIKSCAPPKVNDQQRSRDLSIHLVPKINNDSAGDTTGRVLVKPFKFVLDPMAASSTYEPSDADETTSRIVFDKTIEFKLFVDDSIQADLVNDGSLSLDVYVWLEQQIAAATKSIITPSAILKPIIIQTINVPLN